jgi:hypothetical protein
MCGCCDTTAALIERRVLEHYGKPFNQVFAEKRGMGTVSLRRKQMQLALAGDRTLLIWLGKQYLKQADKQEHSGPDGGAIPVSFEAASAAMHDFLADVAQRKNQSERVQ